MNAPLGIGERAAMTRDFGAHRRERAAIARRLLESAPKHAAALGWDDLDDAPAWLALPIADLRAFARRIGGVVAASTLKLWIDRARVAASREALGDAFFAALLAQPGFGGFDRSSNPEMRGLDRIAAIDVGPTLERLGASTLLAAIAHPAMRTVAGVVLGCADAAEVSIEHAQSIVARAQGLTAQITLDTNEVPR